MLTLSKPVPETRSALSGGELFAALGICAGVFFIFVLFASTLARSDAYAIAACCSPIIAAIAFLIARSSKLQNHNQVELSKYAIRKQKYDYSLPLWERMYFCHRDNVVFIPGDDRGAVPPGRMMSLLDSPRTTSAKTPAKLQAATSAEATPSTTTAVDAYHVMLEDAGKSPQTVATVIAMLTLINGEDAERLVAKAPTRVATLPVKADAERLRELLEASGATVSVTWA
jgi:ribosomal protein L7/L12